MICSCQTLIHGCGWLQTSRIFCLAVHASTCLQGNVWHRCGSVKQFLEDVTRQSRVHMMPRSVGATGMRGMVGALQMKKAAVFSSFPLLLFARDWGDGIYEAKVKPGRLDETGGAMRWLFLWIKIRTVLLLRHWLGCIDQSFCCVAVPTLFGTYSLLHCLIHHFSDHNTILYSEDCPSFMMQFEDGWIYNSSPVIGSCEIFSMLKQLEWHAVELGDVLQNDWSLHLWSLFIPLESIRSWMILCFHWVISQGSLSFFCFFGIYKLITSLQLNQLMIFRGVKLG